MLITGHSPGELVERSERAAWATFTERTRHPCRTGGAEHRAYRGMDSAAADIGHFGRHHGHELDIGVERQCGQVDDRTRDMGRAGVR